MLNRRPTFLSASWPPPPGCPSPSENPTCLRWNLLSFLNVSCLSRHPYSCHRISPSPSHPGSEVGGNPSLILLSLCLSLCLPAPPFLPLSLSLSKTQCFDKQPFYSFTVARPSTYRCISLILACVDTYSISNCLIIPSSRLTQKTTTATTTITATTTAVSLDF